MLSRFAVICAGLIGPVAWFSPNSLAVMVPLLAFLVIQPAGWQGSRAVLRQWPELGLVLLIAAISLLWTPTPKLAVANYGKLLIGLACGLVLIRHLPRLIQADQLVRAVAIGLTVGAVVPLADAALGWPLVRFLRPGTMPHLESGFYSRGGAFAALFLPLLTYLLLRQRQRLAAAGLVVVLAAAIMTVHGIAAKIALLGAGLALPLLAWRPVIAWAAPGVLAVSLAFGTVPFPVKMDPAQTCRWIDTYPSAYHRLLIWGFVSDLVRAQPVQGYGFDSARSLAQGRERVEIRSCIDPSGVQFAELLPMHPHNAPLQIRLELGGIGAFAVILALLALARRGLLTAPRAQRTAAGLIWAAALPMVLLSYGVWQEWWIASLALAAALALTARDET